MCMHVTVWSEYVILRSDEMVCVCVCFYTCVSKGEWVLLSILCLVY